VRFRCHSLVNRYITKQNKSVIQVQDIQKAVEAVMNGKKLRLAAALLALNVSAAFCLMQRTIRKLGNVESHVQF